MTARRINRGRGHSYEIDGERAIGITTAIDGGVPKPALINWAARITVDCAEDRWAELVEMRPSQRRKVLERARWDHRDPAAERGTRAHKLVQQLAQGQAVEPDEDLIGHADAYLRFVDEWQPRELLIERPVFNRTHRYAGTPDLFVDLIDGQRWLLDFKTGENVYSEVALQLAAARYAEFALDDAGAEIPVPQVDAAGVIHLRADGYALIPVPAGLEAFRLFLYAKQIAESTLKDREAWLGDVLQPPSPNGGAGDHARARADIEGGIEP